MHRCIVKQIPHRLLLPRERKPTPKKEEGENRIIGKVVRSQVIPLSNLVLERVQ